MNGWPGAVAEFVEPVTPALRVLLYRHEGTLPAAPAGATVFTPGGDKHKPEYVTTGWTARLVPLTVDGLIYASSMVMLDSTTPEDAVPALARWLLGLGIAATLAANVAHGLLRARAAADTSTRGSHQFDLIPAGGRLPGFGYNRTSLTKRWSEGLKLTV